jgi:branched-chain amino acid transport system ATP-binding protein
MLLTVENLSVKYGNIPALTGLSISVREGTLVALLGANGAGKSTTLNTIAGLLNPTDGTITFGEASIGGAPAFRIVRQGLALVPEGRMVVAPLSVEDNLELSSYARGRTRTASLNQVWELFPRLAERRRQRAGLLSGGEQQMLAIGRAIMTKPKLLLLDEPSMGLSPALTDVVMEAIKRIHESGVTVLLVEQNTALALPLADYAYLIDRGEIVAEGTAQDLEKDPDMIARHLGLDNKITEQEMKAIIGDGKPAQRESI